MLLGHMKQEMWLRCVSVDAQHATEGLDLEKSDLGNGTCQLASVLMRQMQEHRPPGNVEAQNAYKMSKCITS